MMFDFSLNFSDPTQVILGIWAMFSAVGYLLTTGKH